MHDFPLKLGELLEVNIEKLSFGGSGIARHLPDGADSPVVIFVPFSAPGDRLQIKISQIKKRHAEGEIQKILTAGPDRTKAPCAVFGDCGGCNWQHLSYESQLKNKQLIVEDFLKKFIVPGKTTVSEIVPSPQPLHYRNRAQLKFKNGQLGFYRKNSHEIVAVDQCWILEKTLSDKIPGLGKDLLKQSLPGNETKNVALSISPEDFQGSEQDFSSGGFSQVNRFQNENLIGAVIELIRRRAPDAPTASRIFDLYGGSGNFSFPLIDQFRSRQVIGVELHSGAAKTAQDRLKRLNIPPKHAEFYNADVGFFLKRFQLNKSDTILLDPPRIGCSEDVINTLALTGPRQIIYISCDPAALARDLDRLWNKSSGKYQLQKVQCFDMFPQTHHVEVLVELTI